MFETCLTLNLPRERNISTKCTRYLDRSLEIVWIAVEKHTYKLCTSVIFLKDKNLNEDEKYVEINISRFSPNFPVVISVNKIMNIALASARSKVSNFARYFPPSKVSSKVNGEKRREKQGSVG